ncbi:MAG: hypothetical protein ACTHMI_22480 [Mucilaginibacter sp.]
MIITSQIVDEQVIVKVLHCHAAPPEFYLPASVSSQVLPGSRCGDMPDILVKAFDFAALNRWNAGNILIKGLS